ncbi:MAG TPA: tetratricopeptide repeat protein [Bdellovibrionales bacterium]|nr:tetratricopeptide repeat protein [Bdellovibrionales bacterium]
MKLTLLMLSIGVAGMVATSDARAPFAETKKPFVHPPKYAERFHFGYAEPMADVMWIRLLQDLGACRTSGEMQDLPGDEVATCHMGWTYRMADAITTMTPRFRMVYDAAGTLLSVVGGDREGARLIFEKSLKVFPDDWQLHYRAAYHYLHEIKDYRRAGELMHRAADLGAPPWVYALAARLYTREGRAELARTILLDFLERNPEGYAADRARLRLKEIESGKVDQDLIDAPDAAPAQPESTGK